MSRPRTLREGPFTADIDRAGNVEVKQDGYRYNSFILSREEFPVAVRLLAKVEQAAKPRKRGAR